MISAFIIPWLRGLQYAAVSMQIVRQISKSNNRRHSRSPDRTDHGLSGNLGLYAKHMFHPAPNSRTGPVALFFTKTEWPVSRAFPLDVFTKSPLLQQRDVGLRTVGRIRPHIPARIGIVQ